MILLISIAICLITFFAAWWDFKAYKIWLRSFLVVLSGLMLLGFVIQPKLLSSSQTAGYVLLTNGVDLDSFSHTDYDSVYSIQSNQDYIRYRQRENIQWLSSVSMLERHLPSESTSEILGFGADDPLPENYKWIDKLTLPNGGLVLQNAPHEVEVAKSFTLTFKLQPDAAVDSLVIIRDGINLTTAYPDSAGIVEIQDQLFSEGPVHYQIEWIREDSVLTENWNIRAVQPDRLNIAMLLYSPLFEMNYLAESLGERNHEIAVRTRIGQNRFRYDNLNSPNPSAENILSDPDSFDLLFLDVREYQQLSQVEKNRIGNAVNDGLDILLVPPTPGNLQDWITVFRELTGFDISFQELTRLEERLWAPGFVDDELVETNRIPLLNVNFLSLPQSSSQIHQYQGEPVAIRANVQNGSVSTHLFFQSYNWLLGGQPEIYHRFWADYLSELITLEESFLNIATAIPRIDEPVTITFTSSAALLTVHSLLGGISTNVPVINRQNHPDIGSATFWPTNTGWHFAEQGENRTWFYVYESGWEFDYAYQTFRNTKNQIAKQNLNNEFSASSNNRKIPDWIWLISFLGLQGLLWIERKVN